MATSRYAHRQQSIKPAPVSTSWKAVLGIILASVLYLGWLASSYSTSSHLIDLSTQRLASVNISDSQTITLPDATHPITLMKNDPFRAYSRWQYVSSTSMLAKDFIPTGLVDVKVAHADGGITQKLNLVANTAIERMFAAAKKDGVDLIITSSYRSNEQQAALRNSYAKLYGNDYVNRYVAQPGTSEHQTGLAADISSYSKACELDAGACSMSSTAALWLETHSPDYGFILRYPEDKEAVTGIANEPWHFRFVGRDARSLTAAHMTLDEFVQLVNNKK